MESYFFLCSLLDEGDALVFRIAIAIYSLLSARLYVPEKAEVSQDILCLYFLDLSVSYILFYIVDFNSSWKQSSCFERLESSENQR